MTSKPEILLVFLKLRSLMQFLHPCQMTGWGTIFTEKTNGQHMSNSGGWMGIVPIVSLGLSAELSEEFQFLI